MGAGKGKLQGSWPGLFSTSGTCLPGAPSVVVCVGPNKRCYTDGAGPDRNGSHECPKQPGMQPVGAPTGACTELHPFGSGSGCAVRPDPPLGGG